MKGARKIFGVFVLGIVAMICGINSVKATEMSDEFKSYLNKDGKFEFNSVIPTDEDYFTLMVEMVTYDEQQNWLGLMFSDVAEDYSEVDFTINTFEEDEETHRVKLQWNYDETANEKIKNFINTTLKNKTKFNVNDLELVNYWANSVKNNYSSQLAMFSGELKSELNYGNVEFEVSTRGGSSYPFMSETIGFGYFGYNGSIYHVVNGFGAIADHVIYVPTETENTIDALKNAAQKRIDDYLGETDIEVNYESTAWEFWVSYFYQAMRDEWFLDNPSLTLEEFEQMGNIYMPVYPSFEEGFEAELGLSGVDENDFVYTIDIPVDENMGDCKLVIIRRDSSKMVNPVSRTNDLSTDIEISTNAVLPLDTIIKANRLTSGAEYDNLIKLLKLDDSLTFDLKLYANSIDEYITKLEDGTFEVKIPVPEIFKGKKLQVFYVDENDKTEVYEVKEENGYAIFNTNHFSIYTLGATNINSSNISNPNTFDSIGSNVLMLIISFVGIFGILLVTRRKKII